MTAPLPLLAVTPWVWIAVGLVSVPLLVALNAFFVAAEFALVALPRTRIEAMVGRGVAGAKTVEAAAGNLDQAIAATQLGITPRVGRRRPRFGRGSRGPQRRP